MKTKKYTIFLLLLFVFVGNTFAKDRIYKDKSLEQSIQEATACIGNQDCINENIITDTDNIVDLYKAVDKFTGDYIQSKTNVHINYWDYVRMKESGGYNEFDFLTQEYNILRGLGDCLYERDEDNQDLMGKIEQLVPRYTNFYFGDDADSFKMLIAKNYYECALRPENKKFTKEKLEEECLEDAQTRYFYFDLQSQLSQVNNRYEVPETLGNDLKEFEKCHEHDSAKRWPCYEKLNANLMTMKAGYMVNSLNNNVAKVKNKDADLKEYKECVENAQRFNSGSTSCKEALVVQLTDEVINSTPKERHDLMLKTVLARCGKNSGYRAEYDCYQEANIALNIKENVGTKMFYHNLEKIEDTWKHSSTRYARTNKQYYSQLVSDDNYYKKRREFLEEIPNLTSTEIACINNYTGSGYHDMNRHLWSSGSKFSNVEGTPSLIACAMSGMEKISSHYAKDPKNYKETVYRGMGDAPFVKRFESTGDCIVFTGFTSTSYGKNSAFSDKYELKIKNCPAGSKDAGSMVEPISNYDSEKEVLFPPGARFRVTKPADPNQNPMQVELECITEEQHYKDKIDCH
jgi:hypothetical protein